MRRHLTADDHHRDGVHVRRGDAGDRVGHAGTAGDEADADPLRRARIRIRRMYGRLLVPDQHVLERILFENFVVDIEHGAAGIAEHKVDFSSARQRTTISAPVNVC